MSDQMQNIKIKSLADEAMKNIPAILKKHGKMMDDEQIEKLSTHMLAMARRSLTGEALPDFDKSLFDEVSSNSINAAKEVADLFRGLRDEESY